jgi:hypothetical protein
MSLSKAHWNEELPVPKKKIITIQFETTDTNGLKAVFARIVDRLKEGDQADEGMVNGIKYTFDQKFEKNMNFRTEEIDGKLCKVFKSSFN